MNMYLKRLVIYEKFLPAVSLTFNEGLTAIEEKDVVLDALRCIYGEFVGPSYPTDYSFLAEVKTDELYQIRGIKAQRLNCWAVAVTVKGQRENCAHRFFDRLKSNEERESLLYFDSFRGQDYPHRLLQYADPLTYYPSGQLGKVTDGFGQTKAFRGLLRGYVKAFKPILLQKGKGFYLRLNSTGEFTVTNGDSEDRVYLSEGEKMLYHYWCFLCLNEFWSMAEGLRNMHRVNKPLVISGFVNRMDSSVDLRQVLNRTHRLGRQTIITVPKNCDINSLIC